MATPSIPASSRGTPANWSLSQNATLFIALGILAGFFIFTGFMARFYHQTERSTGRRWYAQGEADLKAGRVAEAIQDYRTALVYSRENGDTSSANETYDLHLAEALAASGRVDEARSYFLALAEKEPGRASVNLELARLAARQESQNNLAEASRYYNAAIFGVWDTDPLAQRRAARIEYAKFLLDRGQTAEAQAQLFAMSAALPNATPADAPLHSQAGRLLMEAGANSQALAEYRRALQLEPEFVEAMRGAGMAAFRTEDYAQAARELERSSSAGNLSEEEKHALEISERVQLLDPFIATLSVQQRGSRAAYGFSIALKRLQTCAASKATAGAGQADDELQQLLAEAAKTGTQADERSLIAHPENLPQVMDLAFAMENAAGIRCGQGSLDDTALQLLARSHEGNGQ